MSAKETSVHTRACVALTDERGKRNFTLDVLEARPKWETVSTNGLLYGKGRKQAGSIEVGESSLRVHTQRHTTYKA